MGIKRYIATALVFIVAIGLYVFAFNGEHLTKDLFGYSMTLPIALWIVIPVALLMVASVIHMFYYWVVGKLEDRRIQKDYEQYEQAVKCALLNQEPNATFKTKWFKFPYEILKMTILKDGIDPQSIANPQLQEIIKNINDIRNGEFVELKKYKLQDDNPLLLQDKYNKLFTSQKALLETLKSEPKDSELSKKAFLMLVESGSWADIKKQDIALDDGMIITLIKRYANGDLNELELETLLSSENLNRADLLKCARLLQQKVAPDVLVGIYEKLYNTRAEAIDGYLAVLLELQMIDKFREVLENNDEKELDKFRVLLFLRDNGKHYDLSLFNE